MTGFYGKAYRYKDKVIGVCPTLSRERFMIGYIKPSGSYKRMVPLPLFGSTEEAQVRLDEYARERGLSEAQS